MKTLLCGNEAIAQGAYEAGIRLATSYPGTPASEIMTYLLKKNSKDFYAEWSSNEKVALEMCIGASMLNQRSLCSMKANGLNWCIDTLMSLTKKGITGGLVIVVVDDPDTRYSDVIQDSREFMNPTGFHILEPTTIEECKEFIKIAYIESEQKGQPIFIRLTNKLGHLYAPVELEERIPPRKLEFDKTKYKFNPYSKETEDTIPYFCNGCPHESFYKNLELPKDIIVNGDIGCYEIAGFGNNGTDDKPLREIIDSLFVMGSGVSVSQGQLACGVKSIALVGDGTFWHCGINGLINAVQNKHNIDLIIMDNSCIAMTGQQPVLNMNIENVCASMGVSVEIVNPYNPDEVKYAVKHMLDNPDKINVIISRAECMLKKQRK